MMNNIFINLTCVLCVLYTPKEINIDLKKNNKDT